MANGYLESCNFELAIKSYWQLLVKDPSNSLVNLLVAVCFMQTLASRVTKDKAQTARRAVYFIH